MTQDPQGPGMQPALVKVQRALYGIPDMDREWARLRACCGAHQSTVPPQSASIFMNSWVNSARLTLAPSTGPSLLQKSSMSSCPVP